MSIGQHMKKWYNFSHRQHYNNHCIFDGCQIIAKQVKLSNFTYVNKIIIINKLRDEELIWYMEKLL